VWFVVSECEAGAFQFSFMINHGSQSWGKPLRERHMDHPSSSPPNARFQPPLEAGAT
jgi:hypothetical protein